MLNSSCFIFLSQHNRNEKTPILSDGGSISYLRLFFLIIFKKQLLIPYLPTLALSRSGKRLSKHLSSFDLSRIHSAHLLCFFILFSFFSISYFIFLVNSKNNLKNPSSIKFLFLHLSKKLKNESLSFLLSLPTCCIIILLPQISYSISIIRNFYKKQSINVHEKSHCII